ncbi:MAG: GatB/YqeY domain-containing protein [Leptospiraceae bacterium]|nr:GatB/YqeY domain-containing protein [Leptospiraceae bacterium]MCK6381437.1 GatB/YqeY domain-containing protein [Leptospiraceae bacterium]NUM41256.1 GatB/YqeY domain-containing protein [Leptospiraceae bacterium]
MSLQDKINQDLKDAMKAKEELKLATLRLIKADIQYELTRTGSSSLNDEQVMGILKSNSKKRKETAEEYRKAKRDDLAQKEEDENQIIISYLPPDLSEEEIRKVASVVIQEFIPVGPQDTGKIMGRVMQELKGKNANGALVSSVVKSMLSK